MSHNYWNYTGNPECYHSKVVRQQLLFKSIIYSFSSISKTKQDTIDFLNKA